MTLSGFAIGIGMLLDNGVVMIEAISCDLRENTLWKQSTSIVSSIISSTLTTVAIFIPIVFINYEYRMLYGGLALTVTFSLISSVVCALVIIPAGMGFFSKYSPAHYNFTTKTSLIIEKKTLSILRKLWKKRIISNLMILAIIIILPITVIKMDKEFLDPAKGNEITAFVEMEAGTSLAQTESIVSKVEDFFVNHPDIERVNARIEKWHASMDIKYLPGKYKRQQDFIEILKKDTDAFTECFVHYDEKSSGNSREIDIDIIGDNDSTIRKIAQKSASEIHKNPLIEQVVLKFKEGQPSYTWVIDRGKAQQLNVAIQSAGEQLRWAIYGPVALKYIKNNKEMDLRISYPKDYKNRLSNLEEMLITNNDNQKIYIKELGDFVRSQEPVRYIERIKEKL